MKQFAVVICLQREVCGPGAEERDHEPAADHPVPDEEKRNGLSAGEHERWANRLSLRYQWRVNADGSKTTIWNSTWARTLRHTSRKMFCIWFYISEYICKKNLNPLSGVDKSVTKVKPPGWWVCKVKLLVCAVRLKCFAFQPVVGYLSLCIQMWWVDAEHGPEKVTGISRTRSRERMSF